METKLLIQLNGDSEHIGQAVDTQAAGHAGTEINQAHDVPKAAE